MNKYTYTDNGKTYTRINKPAAEKAYNAGETIIVCACNLRPGAPWYPEIQFSKERADNKPFKAMVNAFEYYYCGYPGPGKYASFYIETE